MKNKETWKTVIQIIVSVLSAVLTTLTTTSCMGHGPILIENLELRFEKGTDANYYARPLFFMTNETDDAPTPLALSTACPDNASSITNAISINTGMVSTFSCLFRDCSAISFRFELQR